MAYTDIDDPSAFFQTTLYTGNGASSRSITHGGNSDLQSDWTWIKNRTDGHYHNLNDSVRGVNKKLRTGGVAGEVANSSSGYLSAFASDGFTVTGGSSNMEEVNTNSDAYVSWNWKKTADAGFDIVAYTGSGSAKTVSHSLSAIPKMIIVKKRSGDGQWTVQHTSLGATHWIELSATSAADNSAAIWNNTEPTSSVFTVGTNARTNTNEATYIAYLFADKPCYAKMGTYKGNGGESFIHTGFKVGWLLVKVTDGTNGWLIIDTKRSPANPQGKYVYTNTGGAEGTVTYGEFFSNGFGWKGTNSIAVNQLNKNYIFYAIAENPFVTSTGIPATAR